MFGIILTFVIVVTRIKDFSFTFIKLLCPRKNNIFVEYFNCDYVKLEQVDRFKRNFCVKQRPIYRNISCSYTNAMKNPSTKLSGTNSNYFQNISIAARYINTNVRIFYGCGRWKRGNGPTPFTVRQDHYAFSRVWNRLRRRRILLLWRVREFSGWRI